MSTGNINLDRILNKLLLESNQDEAEKLIKNRFISLNDKDVEDLAKLLKGASNFSSSASANLVATIPVSFSTKVKYTKNVVENLIQGCNKSILITGYSMSNYFTDLVDVLIAKSQKGIFVKFFVNDIEHQSCFDKLLSYQGKYLEIYNYPKNDDSMAALHAKIISVDGEKTLITSANLSYHGQEGNIELGTLVKSKDFASQVDQLFSFLVMRKDSPFIKMQ